MRRHGLSCLAVDLQCADDALFIVWVERRGAFGIDGGQFGKQCLATLRRPAALKLRANRTAGRAGSKAVAGEEADKLPAGGKARADNAAQKCQRTKKDIHAVPP